MLLMNRMLRSRLDAIRPSVAQRVEERQSQQKADHDAHAVDRSFAHGDHVYVRDFSRRPEKWIPGTIVDVTGPVSFQIELENGTVCRRHQDHIRKRTVKVNPSQEIELHVPGSESRDQEVRSPTVTTETESSEDHSLPRAVETPGRRYPQRTDNSRTDDAYSLGGGM